MDQAQTYFQHPEQPETFLGTATTPLQVSGTVTATPSGTQTVAGTVTANAGTNLNTSTLATQATLASLLTELQGKADLAETQPVSFSGAIDTELPAAAALSDTLGNPTTPMIGAALLGTNTAGTAWERVRTDGLGRIKITDGGNGPLVIDMQRVAAQSIANGGGAETTGCLRVTLPNNGTGVITANPATDAGKTVTYISVNQSGAGTTVLATADATKKHKIVGATLVMSVLGTLKFTDGVADLTGPMDLAANAGFVWSNHGPFPYTQTGAINRALNLVTTLGAARGVVAVLTEA